MDDETVKLKLDTLFDFQLQRDKIDKEKRALLDQIQIPEEVKAIIADGNRRINELKTPTLLPDPEFDKQIQAELDAIVIPDEIKSALAEIDRKRALVGEKKLAYYREIEMEMVRLRADVESQRLAIQAEVDEKVRSTYDAIAQRKLDIEDEFAGKGKAADDNIKKLTQEILDAVKELGHTVKGQYKMAVYVRGRITWNTDDLERLIMNGHQELLPYRKEGQPSVTIRGV